MMVLEADPAVLNATTASCSCANSASPRPRLYHRFRSTGGTWMAPVRLSTSESLGTTK